MLHVAPCSASCRVPSLPVCAGVPSHGIYREMLESRFRKNDPTFLKSKHPSTDGLHELCGSELLGMKENPVART